MIKLMADRFRCKAVGSLAQRAGRLTAWCVLGFALAVPLSVAGCLPPLALEGRPCPCAEKEGFTCCLEQQICARECPIRSGTDPVTPGPVKLSSFLTQGAPVNALSGTEATAVAFEVNADSLWVGTKCGGLFRRQNGTWTLFDSYNSQIPDSGVHALFIDADGTKWITSRRGFLYSYDNTTFKVFGESPLVYPGGRSRQPMLPDANGGLWFAANSGGLAHLTNQKIDKVSAAPWSSRGTPLEHVTGLGKDGRGGLWATARNGPAAQWTAAGWVDASADLAPPQTRVVSASSTGGPWFATASALWWLGEGAPQEVFANTPQDTAGIVLIRQGVQENIAAAYANRPGLLRGTRTALSYTPLGSMQPVDVASDEAGGWWLAGRSSGVTHIDDKGLVLNAFAISGGPPAPWREQPLSTLVKQTAESVEISDVLQNPFAYAGRKLQFRGRVVSQPPSIRFEDDSGRVQLIGPIPRRELLEFWVKVMKPMREPPLPYWADGPEKMDFFGYVEIGGCNGEVEETTLALYIVEYYPTAASATMRDSIKAAMLSYLETSQN